MKSRMRLKYRMWCAGPRGAHLSDAHRWRLEATVTGIGRALRGGAPPPGHATSQGAGLARARKGTDVRAVADGYGGGEVCAGAVVCPERRCGMTG
jgi:hypothetical protein